MRKYLKGNIKLHEKQIGIKRHLGYTVLFILILLGFSLSYNFRDNSAVKQLSLLYCLDYSLGFCSRFFIGSVLKLFVPVLTVRYLDNLAMAVTIIVGILISAVLAHIFCKVKEKDRSLLMLIITFCLVSPIGWYQFVKMRGFLEIYTFLIALLCLIIQRRPNLRWFIPVLCFIGLSIHYIFLLTFIPLIFSIQLYEIAKEPQKDKVALFFASFGVSFFSSIYYVFFANQTLKVNYEGMIAYIQQRMPTIELYDTYIQYYFFSEELKNLPGYAAPQNAFDYISLTLRYVGEAVINNNDKVTRLLFLAALLILILFQFIWIINYLRYRKKQKEGAPLRWVYLLNCLLPFIWLPLFLLSMDYERFFGIVFCNVFMLLLYYIFDENQEVMDTLRFVLKGIQKKPYLSLFAVIVLLAIRIMGG